jgi:DMSO/TMAO reductase YedYZ molybdopterin-dependent catalytic subunit
VFGRVAGPGRRGFLKGAGLATMSALLGASIPFHRNVPAGLIPAALAEALKNFVIEGKDGITVLIDRPVNTETPAHLLDDAVTPIERHCIRNNGNLPENVTAAGWKLVVDGEVEQQLELTIDDLKSGSTWSRCSCSSNAPVTAAPATTRPSRATSGPWARWAAPNGPGCATRMC